MNLLTIGTKISLTVMGGSKHSVKCIEKVVRSRAKVSRPQKSAKSVPISPVESCPLPLAERTEDTCGASRHTKVCWSPTSLGLAQVPVKHFKVCTNILVLYSPPILAPLLVLSTPPLLLSPLLPSSISISCSLLCSLNLLHSLSLPSPTLPIP